MSATVAGYMTALADFLPVGRAAVLLAVAESSEAGMRELLAAQGGEITYRKAAAEVLASGRTLLEYTWNHTTLHALKIDKSLTYIQSSFDPVRKLEQVRALEQALGGEVLMHLEFLRTRDGAQGCSGLQLIRYSSDARLDEIMRIHREHGVAINNPHVYMVEDGKQGPLSPGVVETKESYDPFGLLNPGKLRAWAEREGTRGHALGAAA